MFNQCCRIFHSQFLVINCISFTAKSPVDITGFYKKVLRLFFQQTAAACVGPGTLLGSWCVDGWWGGTVSVGTVAPWVSSDHQLSCYTTSNMWNSHHPLLRPASWRCPVTGECQFIQILCLSSADSLSFHTWKSDFNSAVKIMSLLSHLRSSRVEETGHRFTSKHWMWCRDASACNIIHKTRGQSLTLGGVNETLCGNF